MGTLDRNGSIHSSSNSHIAYSIFIVKSTGSKYISLLFDIKLSLSLHRKLSFPLQISSVNVTKVSCGLVTFTEEILDGKLYLMCSVLLYLKKCKKTLPSRYLFNPIQNGSFRGCLTDGLFALSLPKICLTYPTMMKLGTVIPYLKKIQKLYK